VERVLVIGANGLLGASLIEKLRSKYQLITVTRVSENSDYNVDMTSVIECARVLSHIKPDIIINLAALTNVDLCESNIGLAYNVNTKIAENISQYRNPEGSAFILHISTDHVYDAENSKECDVIIKNSYAMTKYCAEKTYDLDNTTILRTNFFGKSLSDKSEGLCDSIYQLAKSGKKLKLFNDVYFSPLSINTLCDVILTCLEKKIGGVFNVGSKDGLSKEFFLKEFLNLSGLPNIKYQSISSDEVESKTARPKDMRMNTELFEKVFSYELTKLKNEIESVANEFKKCSVK
jgi:dTDP-4-dehydrorhamnose reductase